MLFCLTVMHSPRLMCSPAPYGVSFAAVGTSALVSLYTSCRWSCWVHWESLCRARSTFSGLLEPYWAPSRAESVFSDFNTAITSSLAYRDTRCSYWLWFQHLGKLQSAPFMGLFMSSMQRQNECACWDINKSFTCSSPSRILNRNNKSSRDRSSFLCLASTLSLSSRLLALCTVIVGLCIGWNGDSELCFFKSFWFQETILPLLPSGCMTFEST